MKAKLVLIVLVLCAGRVEGAEGTPSIVMLRGSYRSTAAVAKDYRTGTYVRMSNVDEGERPTVSISRAAWPYLKAEPVYGPPVVAPPAVQTLGQRPPSRNWPVFIGVPVHVQNVGGGMILGGPLDGTVLPGPRGGMVFGGPLEGSFFPGCTGGMILGGPLDGTILPPGWR